MNLLQVKSVEDLDRIIKNGEIDTFSKAIRAKCLDCSAYEMSEVRNCHNTDCHLHPFRLGRRLKTEKSNVEE